MRGINAYHRRVPKPKTSNYKLDGLSEDVAHTPRTVDHIICLYV